VYDLFINGKPVNNSPWFIPSYFSSISLLENNTNNEIAESLEWATQSPVHFHAFLEVPTEFSK
jgi:hypothetical protein